MFADRLVKKAIRTRFQVELPGNGGAFTGVLVDADKSFWIFDHCATVPTRPGETVEQLPGRIWVVHRQSPAPYLQEVSL
jgi:hypothetical protein